MNARIRRASEAALALALTTILPSCVVIDIFDEDDGISNTRFEARRSVSWDIPAENRSRLRVEGVSGSIEIIGDPAATAITIYAECTVGSESRSDAEHHLDDLDVIVRELAAEVEVRTDQPSHTRGRRYEVDYLITVPSDFRVVTSQVNGNIAIETIDDFVDVTNVNGNVSLHDLLGDTEVSLTNGNIDASVDLRPGGLIQLQAVNGNVDLDIPWDASAELFAQVTNGSISLRNLTLYNQTGTSRSIRGKLSDGQGTIDVTTVNGNIIVTGT